MKRKKDSYNMILCYVTIREMYKRSDENVNKYESILE